MPSIDAEAWKSWSRFSALRQSGRPMVENVNDCMTVRNQLEAVGEIVPDKQFVDKLLNVDRELSYLIPMCYNPESAGSQAPGPDVRACRRRSDIPVRGGQYVLTAVSRHWVACET